MSTLKHARAILLLPVLVIVVIPAVLVCWTGTLNVGWSLVMPFGWLPIIVGLLLFGLGLTLMVHTMRLFATVGGGTLAPWDPTQDLVVRGVYQHVRNPMIIGVYCVLLGEALLLGSPPLLYWFVVFVIANGLYVPLVEEHSMLRRFGRQYTVYKRHVPRWVPRLTPWDAQWGDEGEQGS